MSQESPALTQKVPKIMSEENTDTVEFAAGYAKDLFSYYSGIEHQNDEIFSFHDVTLKERLGSYDAGTKLLEVTVNFYECIMTLIPFDQEETGHEEIELSPVTQEVDKDIVIKELVACLARNIECDDLPDNRGKGFPTSREFILQLCEDFDIVLQGGLEDHLEDESLPLPPATQKVYDLLKEVGAFTDIFED